MKLPFSDLEQPTIRMSYGDVPILEASAGIKRVVALAYIAVWAWFRHLENSQALRKPYQRSMIILIDEVESHLHPRWQRTIVPALMNVIAGLEPEVSAQIHLATHSPMVMVSAEPIFDEDLDDLFHLRRDGKTVILDELEFIKRGRVDLWLMSEIFGLGNARSVEGEKAIEEAKRLQDMDEPSSREVIAVNERLVEHLAQDDDFWPRWRYFAKQHGVR